VTQPDSKALEGQKASEAPEALKANQPAIILVAPQMGENIGAAARAMFNFNLRELRLVAPRDGWPNLEAERNSAGALEKMDVRVYDTLEAASADLHYMLATTARPRDLNKPVFTPKTAIAEITGLNAKASKTGLVFGGERAGLSNDHIALCDGIITIPTNPDFSSLNLAQSVLLLCWEWFHMNQPANGHSSLAEIAPKAQFEEFFTRLEQELDTGGFFKSAELKPTVLRNLRTMFLRGGFSDQEIRSFHGIISALIGKNKKPSD
jgi:tRNA/rRNA methyltransferase